MGGQFLLRLEDTDQKRTIHDAEERLYKDLRWAGLQWDEGPEVGGPYGPYKQSERTHLYKQHAGQLLTTPHAYRCFCTSERLQTLAQHRKELGLPTDYDRTCASIPHADSDDRAHNGEAFVIRLRAPEAYPDFHDLIYGRVGRANSGANAGVTHKHGEVVYEDPVLLKSDGHPTYHLANVVDDHLMQITHVVRASEWLSSTPKHLALYSAFDWQPPVYAHVGLLVDEKGRKLSKRNMDSDLGAFTSQGLLKDAIVNFAALLGWSHSRRSDVMDLTELVSEFEMNFTKGNTTVTMGKLWYLQRAHAARAATLQTSVLGEMAEAIRKRVELDRDTFNATSPKSTLRDLQYIKQILTHDARNYTTASHFAERNRYFFREPPTQRDPNTWINPAPNVATLPALFNATQSLLDAATVPEWNAKTIDSAMRQLSRDAVSATPGVNAAEKDSVTDPAVTVTVPPRLTTQEQKDWYKALCKFLRWVFVDGSEGPGMAATMEILGRERCGARLGAITSEQYTGKESNG